MPDAATVSADDAQRARAALIEVTPAPTVGELLGSTDEGDGVISVHFRVEMAGYPGWRWTASIAHVHGAEPTVLETEMTPGDDALLAPDWVPWVDRLADYHAAQDAAELAQRDADAADDDVADDGDSDDDSDSEDDDSDEDSDDDSDVDDSDDESDDSDGGIRSLLHAGDLDGVDIDSLDEEADDEEADDDELDDDDSDQDESGDDEAGDDESDDDGFDDDGDDVRTDDVKTDDVASAATAEDVEQPEGAEHQADRAGDEPADPESGNPRPDEK